MERTQKPKESEIKFSPSASEISHLGGLALELKQVQDDNFEDTDFIDEDYETNSSYDVDTDYNDDDFMDKVYDEIEIEPKTINEITVDQEVLRELNLPNLPSGYAFMGGAARAIYQKQLLGEKVYVRDLDIVAIEDFDPDLALAEGLSQKYMPEDYSHGYGVKAETIDRYFTSRDFTINEILVTADKIYVTPEAELALADKIIELGVIEKDNGDYVKSQKLAAKAVLLEQIFKSLYGRGEIADLDRVFYGDIRPFFLALHLNKALQFSDGLGRKYIKSLVDYHIIDQDYKKLDLDQACQQLADQCWGGFEFNYQENKVNINDLEAELLDQSDGLLGSQIYAETSYPDALHYGGLKQRDQLDRKTGRKFHHNTEI